MHMNINKTGKNNVFFKKRGKIGSKNTFRSSLTNIDGIGEVRAKALLKYFRTRENISNADLQELENAPKMTKDSALTVYRYFHSDEEK